MRRHERTGCGSVLWVSDCLERRAGKQLECKKTAGPTSLAKKSDLGALGEIRFCLDRELM